MQSYLDTLKATLTSRMARNAKYSLRALARDLGVTSARLSEVLSGKKGLSRKSGLQIAIKLGLNENEKQDFCDSIEASHSRSPVAKKLAQKRLQERLETKTNWRVLKTDNFRVISEWYYLTILELMRLPSYVDKPEWIAEKLDLKSIQVKLALERLEKYGHIKIINGKRIPMDELLVTTDGTSSEDIKKYHEKMLQKSVDALYLQPVLERDFFSFVMTLDSNDIPEVRARIRTFVESLNKDFANKPTADRVYNYGSQLIKMTK